MVIRCTLCNRITGVFYYVVEDIDRLTLMLRLMSTCTKQTHQLVKHGVICSGCKGTLRLHNDKMLIQNNGVVLKC